MRNSRISRNTTINRSPCKTPRRGRIPSHYEFAPNSFSRRSIDDLLSGNVAPLDNHFVANYIENARKNLGVNPFQGGTMFNNTVLEVAIGLAFCYASVTLIVSSINEGIASALKLRSKTLLSGIKSLLNDQDFKGLAKAIYNHTLVNPMDAGLASSEEELKNKPSYVEPQHFALALIDTLQTVPGDFAQLGKDIDSIQDPQLKQSCSVCTSKPTVRLRIFETRWRPGSTPVWTELLAVLPETP